MKRNTKRVLIAVSIVFLTIITISALVIIEYNLKEKQVARISLELKEQIEKLNTENIYKNNDEQKLNSEIMNKKINITSRSLSRKRDSIVAIEEPKEEKLEETIEEFIEVTIPIEEVTISIDMDLTERTGLSKLDFVKLISNVKEDRSGFFKENSELIYDLCEKYELNEIFFCGLISAESGWEIPGPHRSAHNYISLMSANGLIKFGSTEEGLESAARILHERYLTPGGCFYYGKTLSAVKTRFCPASPTWTQLVYGRMKQIMY